MENLEAIIAKLRDSEQTPKVQFALLQAVNLRSCLAAAYEDIKSGEKSDRAVVKPTKAQQKEVNKPNVKEIEVADAELVEAKASFFGKKRRTKRKK